MSVKDWKFHDYDMLIDAQVKEGRDINRYPVVYKLTNLQ